MNTSSTNPTTASNRWAHFSQTFRGYLGVVLSAGLAVALLLVVLMPGCINDEAGIVGVFDNTAPLAGSISPSCGAAGVALNQKISVNFNEAMDSSTVTSATFTLAGPGGAPVSGSVTYVSATSVATLTPASNLAASTTYTYTIRGGASGVKDMAGNSLANNFGCSFTTGAAPDVTPPTVVSTSPANNATGVTLSKVSSKGSTRVVKGAALNKTSSVTAGRIITATFSKAMDPLTITASTFLVTGPGVTPVTGLVTYAGTSFTATFLAANNLAPSTTYTGTITTGSKDVAGNALAANYVWTFTTGASPDITSPTVILTDPLNNAAGVALNKKIAAIFSEAMNQSTLNATTFTLKQGTTSVLGAVTSTGTTVLFTPASNLAPNTAFTATISTGAMDTTGNALASNYIWNFTTGVAPDITPPTVISTDPANNATGVALNKKIAATFSEAMDPLTLGTATFTLRQGTTVVSGTLTYAGTTEIFTPASNLTANTVYTATMSTGVKDLAGNALASNYVWSFTTAAAADVTPPTVISTEPASNATGVSLAKKIAATFSESMDPSSLTTASVTVTGLGGAPVTGTISYAIGSSTVTFIPASNLAANTTYTATVKGSATGAKDLAGNALASNYVWTFTTGGIPDITPPTVVSTDPPNNATGVPLAKVTAKASARVKGAALNSTSGVAAGKIITATFSEAMDPLTITSSSFLVTGPGVTPVTGLVTYAGASFTATFIAASNLAPNTTYTGTITTDSKDLAGNALANNYVWTFTTGATPDITPPTVIFTDPANGVTGVAINKKIAATFSEAMKLSTITSATFTLQQGSTSVPGAVAYAGTVAIFTPANNLAINTTYTATITTGAKDSAGNGLASNYVWNFTTGVAPDIIPPVVISTDPANNTTGVAINKKIIAEFSEVMDVLTMTTSTFTLQQGTTPISGAVTYAGTGATFAPSSNLASSTVYTATITTGAKDLAGNALASSYIWNFTTGAAPDTTRPVVISTDPPDNSSGINLGRTITALFSEAMDPLTINAATYTLTRTGGVTVTGKVTYSAKTASFNPDFTLISNAIYTATITTGAKDLAGNALARNYVWSFSGVVLPTVYTVAVSPNPLTGGLTGGGGTFSAGDPAIVRATPNVGYTFTNWTEGVSIVSTNPIYSFTVFGNRTLVANFTPIPYIVALSSNPAAGGTTGGSGTFNFGSSVTVTATPNAGYTFTNWTEGLTIVSTSASYTFTISGNRTLVANFTTIPYTVALSSNPAAGGTTGGGGIYGSGSSVTVTATPNAGYTFTNWTEGVTVVSASASYTFTIAGNRTLVANFTAIPYTVALSSNPAAGGTTGGGGTFNSGSSVTVTATPNAGYTFTNWTEGVTVVSASASYTFTIAGNRTLVANFALSGPPPVDLGSAKRFGGFGGNAGITNQGIFTQINNGNIATTAASTLITGFHDATAPPFNVFTETPLNIGAVADTIYTATAPLGSVPGAVAAQALLDAQAAYIYLAGLPPGGDPNAGELGGLTLAPGTYTSAGGTFKITSVDLTLDGQNNPNARFVFQMASSLTVGAAGPLGARSVILIRGAQAKNVFWQVGSSATINGAGGGTMVGTIIASAGVTFSTAGNVALTRLEGRALSLIASVTMVNTIINVPLP